MFIHSSLLPFYGICTCTWILLQYSMIMLISSHCIYCYLLKMNSQHLIQMAVIYTEVTSPYCMFECHILHVNFECSNNKYYILKCVFYTSLLSLSPSSLSLYLLSLSLSLSPCASLSLSLFPSFFLPPSLA